MNEMCQFPRKDYVIFSIDGTENLIAVDMETSKELADKLNRHKTFSSIPSEYEVEVVPLVSRSENRNVFIDSRAKFSLPLNRLRPVINPLVASHDKGSIA